jgi:peptide/nickel transport system permease protein
MQPQTPPFAMIDSPVYIFLRRMRRHPSGIAGFLIILFFLIVAIFASVLAPYSPIEQHAKDRLQPPDRQYLLGTDEFGRDHLSRLMHGATNSLTIALVSVSVSFIIGTLIGTFSGYFGGWTDNMVMRGADLLFAFPAILLALAIAAALGPGTRNTIIAITVVYLPIFARVARGSVLTIKTLEYIDASRSQGAGHSRIVFGHLIPNSLAPSIVQLSLAFSWAILTEAALSFLGLGAVPPAPSWGSMLSESRTLMEIAPWLAIFPGLAIMLAVLGFNLLGDGLRDVLDPRIQFEKMPK